MDEVWKCLKGMGDQGGEGDGKGDLEKLRVWKGRQEGGDKRG